jgi:hypothetical protein
MSPHVISYFPMPLLLNHQASTDGGEYPLNLLYNTWGPSNGPEPESCGVRRDEVLRTWVVGLVNHHLAFTTQ